MASFFISRIDTAVDQALAERAQAEADLQRRAELQSLNGKAAIANAKLAYQSCQQIYGQPPWLALAAQGARPQRLLWASTSTKNPRYRDVIYIEELIGPDTVNTAPPATLDAFREHGIVRQSLTENEGQAEETLAALAAAGIDMDGVTKGLLDAGLQLFQQAFDKLLQAVERSRQGLK